MIDAAASATPPGQSSLHDKRIADLSVVSIFLENPLERPRPA
jgi:hypothetical protein